MYSTIISIVFLVLVVIEEIVYFILDEFFSDEGMKIYFTFKRVIRCALLVEFVIFNLLFSFIRAEYKYQLFFQIAGNILSVVYFLFDILYLSQRKRAYILWLQRRVFKKTTLKDAFEILNANGIKFEEKRKISQQNYSIVYAGNKNGLCIYMPSKDGGLLLKPHVKMNEETLLFYALKIEIDYDEGDSLEFYEGDLSREAIFEYDFGFQMKLYLWIKNKLLSKKGKTITLYLSLSLLFVGIIIFIIFYQIYKFDPFAWMGEKV